MSAKKKTLTLCSDQPYLSIQTSMTVRPTARGKGVTKTLFEEGECREEIVWGVRSNMQHFVTREEHRPGGPVWDKRRVSNGEIDLSLGSLKQAGKTVLALQHDDYGDAMPTCTRPCCSNARVQVLDTLVGNLGLLLDVDPYYGDWWRSPETKHGYGFNYYGVNNSCLEHPALLHIILGMFRQAYLLYDSGKDAGLLEAVPYKDTEKALTNADWKQAWKNIEAARRWIEVSGGPFDHWPFPTGYFDRLRALHTALYKHGLDEVFQASSVVDRWEVEKYHGSEIDDFDSNISSNINGAWTYFGGKKLTESGNRLFKLAA